MKEKVKKALKNSEVKLLLVMAGVIIVLLLKGYFIIIIMLRERRLTERLPRTASIPWW